MLCRLPSSSCVGRAARPLSAARCSASRATRVVVPRATAAADVVKKEAEVSNNKPKKDEEEAGVEHDVPDPKVSSKQVAAFLSTLVEETDIAELHLKVGTFDLKVRRSTAGLPQTAAAAAAAAAPAASALGSVDLAPAPAAAPATPVESIDESLIYVNSPKVGIFRRGKYAGGKRVGKGNLINVGDQVKKGQALAYVEQLGTHFAIEAPQAGEVAKVMIEDGAPVEYQQVVVEIAPFFGGHIIGDQKYA